MPPSQESVSMCYCFLPHEPALLESLLPANLGIWEVWESALWLYHSVISKVGGSTYCALTYPTFTHSTEQSWNTGVIGCCEARHPFWLLEGHPTSPQGHGWFTPFTWRKGSEVAAEGNFHSPWGNRRYRWILTPENLRYLIVSNSLSVWTCSAGLHGGHIKMLPMSSLDDRIMDECFFLGAFKAICSCFLGGSVISRIALF